MRVELRALRALRAFVIAAACAATARAQTAADGPRRCAKPADPTLNLRITQPHGSIRFVGWDRDSLAVYGTTERPDEFYCVGGGSGFKLGVQGMSEKGESGRAKLVIYLPRRATVNIRTLSADIAAENIGGLFFSVSGSIRLSGHVSSAEAESINGNIDLNVSAPWVKARSGSGHVLVRGDPQDVDASTVGGTLSIASASILRGQFTSVTGDIHYAASPAPNAIFEFSDHNGSVDLLLPANVSAALALSTISGPIENGFARVRPASGTPRSMRISLGRGESQLTVRTFKGTIRLRSQ